MDRVRDAVHQVAGADATVGGGTAVVLDSKRASSHDNKVIIPVVLVLVFLILTLLLRSIVAPVVLIATVVLSFLAALGIGALVFTTCSASRVAIRDCRCCASYSWWRSASTTTSS